MLAVPPATGFNKDVSSELRKFISGQNFVISNQADVENDISSYQARRSAVVQTLGGESGRNAYLAFHKLHTRIAPRLEVCVCFQI